MASLRDLLSPRSGAPEAAGTASSRKSQRPQQSHRSLNEPVTGGHRIPLVLLAALAVAAAASMWALITYPDASRPYWGIIQVLTDLHVYRWGGEHIEAGLPLYDGLIASLDPGQSWRGPMPWTYTPFAAAGFALLVPMSLQLMEIVWVGGIFVSIFLVCRLILGWLGYRSEARTTWAAVFLSGAMLFTEPVRTTIWLGQINMALLLLLVADAASRGRLRGALTGIAAGIKLTPAFMWAHFFVTRQFRALAVSIGTFALTIVIGAIIAPRDSLHYWSGGLLDAARIGNIDAPSNQSINGILAEYVFHGAPPVWAWLLVAVPAAIIALVIAHYVHARGQPQLAFVLSGMTGCVVSPFSWGHHWVWFVPLFVVLLHLLVRHARRGWALLAWVLPFALYFLVGAWSFVFPNPDQPTGAWIATGWFMSAQALSGFLGPFIREPYIVVWVLTLVLAPLVTALVRTGSKAADVAEEVDRADDHPDAGPRESPEAAELGPRRAERSKGVDPLRRSAEAPGAAPPPRR
ncbi:glycosyltransferase 87 family protein [Dietzia sp.]|uniref:glycosyltransferase 87 family protein n=1 Tax=Dietzia sp. TaxID=1871616 RepID=UPI002FD96352